MLTETSNKPDAKSVQSIIDFAKHGGAKNIAFAGGSNEFLDSLSYDHLGTEDFDCFVLTTPYEEPGRDNLLGKPLLSGKKALATDIDTLIILDRVLFRTIVRQIEPFYQKGVLCLPLSSNFLVEPSLTSMGKMDKAWNTHPFVNYISRCGLRGHYLEFGTFWGQSFFTNYFLSNEWLEGKYFAFDSFSGLSAPEIKETLFTAGDFTEGAYACNEKSFRAYAKLLDIPPDRLEVVSGFYDQTLAGVHPKEYGIAPNSVSVCYIDCDILAPTLQVLNFVSDLLEEGALIYFDDWRLCRASPEVGERAAALRWLAENPDFELIEFTRLDWQHQWFIFQKTQPATIAKL